MSTLCQIKCICGEFYCTTLFKTNLRLKHIEFLLRLIVTMLCRIRYAETVFDASRNDLKFEDKERCGAPKKFGDKELEEILDEDRSQTLAELGKTFHVDKSSVSKRLKVLATIQKQRH